MTSAHKRDTPPTTESACSTVRPCPAKHHIISSRLDAPLTDPWSEPRPEPAEPELPADLDETFVHRSFRSSSLVNSREHRVGRLPGSVPHNVQVSAPDPDETSVVKCETFRRSTHVRQDGGSRTGRDPAAQVDSQLFHPPQVGLFVLVHPLECEFVAKLVDRELSVERVRPTRKQVDDEFERRISLYYYTRPRSGRAGTHLSDSIRNLFTDQGQEPGVQTGEPFFGAQLGEPGC
jgi:hypothetical protein